MKIPPVILLSLVLATVVSALVLGGDETGRMIVDVRGYDGASRIDASLLTPDLGLVENQTVYSETLVFDNVTVGNEYFVLILYKGVAYSKRIVMNETMERVEFRVFNVTSDDAGIVTSFHKMALRVRDNKMILVEVLIYKNGGTQVYNGTLRVNLPMGYQNLNTSIMGCCMKETKEGFVVTNLMEPIKPNHLYQISLSYTLSPTSDEYEFVKRAVYPTSTLMLLVEKEKVTPKSFSNLINGSGLEFEGKYYNLFTASNLSENETVSLTLSGFATAQGLTTMWIGAALISAVVVALGFVSIRSKGPTKEDLLAKKEAIFSVLDQLERDLKEGKIGEEEYEELRAKYREEGVKITRKIEEITEED